MWRYCGEVYSVAPNKKGSLVSRCQNAPFKQTSDILTGSFYGCVRKLDLFFFSLVSVSHGSIKGPLTQANSTKADTTRATRHLARFVNGKINGRPYFARA